MGVCDFGRVHRGMSWWGQIKTNPINNLQPTTTNPIAANVNANRTSSPSVVTAGINIRGTLKHPSISFYSVPGNLSQADILSYLLLGQPSNANADSISLLSQTIGTLNIGGKKGIVGGITDPITQSLGLNEFGVQSQITPDALGTSLGKAESVFVVGRYISSRIYVRYSRGLTTSLNIIQVRYLLGTHWAIQSETSPLGNGGDIIYTIQKN